MAKKNGSAIRLTGYNHLALVCSDMERTVDFYCNILGMTLVKAFDLPNGRGQHFFFNIGDGNLLAFFWLPDAPAAAPGVASPDPGVMRPRPEAPGERRYPMMRASMATAVGSMNHVAFDCPVEQVDEWRATLKAKGVAVTPVINHDDTPPQRSREINDTTYIRTFYFLGPDDILLEIGSLTRAVDPTKEVEAAPATLADKGRYLAKMKAEGVPLGIGARA